MQISQNCKQFYKFQNFLNLENSKQSKKFQQVQTFQKNPKFLPLAFQNFSKISRKSKMSTISKNLCTNWQSRSLTLGAEFWTLWKWNFWKLRGGILEFFGEMLAS